MKKYGCYFYLLFLSVLAKGQTGQMFDSVINKYAVDFPQEKIYLHFDKSVYYPGETIWFKAYVMEGLVPAGNSKTLYVDYIADNGSVMTHVVSPLVEGHTNGQYTLPDNFSGNLLHIRAYTRWMLNFDTAFLYAKELRVIHKTPVSRSVIQGSIPSISFFPEGGDLIADVVNKVAFKATDQWGRPVMVSGKVTDQKGTFIDSLHLVHDGMGFFKITPSSSNAYTVRWTVEKGIQQVALLPAAQPQGVAMQVEVQGTKRIIFFNSGSPLSPLFQQLHLVGTMNQVIAFKTDIRQTGSLFVKRIIPTENLPSGILTLTLFDANWNAIAERITFINNHDFSFETKMEVKHWGLSKRKRNELEITIPENIQDASLSISVTDAAIEKDTTTNIITQLLLAGDLRGSVYHPAYYFSDQSALIDQHLDLVMLTNGWRRFKWEDVVKGKFPVVTYPRDTSYMTLSGKLFGVPKSQLSGKESIVLIVKDKDSANKMLVLSVNREGTFSDPEIVLFDTVQVYYSLKSKLLGQAEARFMTDRLPAPNYSAFSKNFKTPDPSGDTTGFWYHAALAAQANRLDAFRKGQVMETVLIKTKIKPPVEVLDDKYASGMFKDADAYKFDLVNDISSSAYRNIIDYLQGKVAGLMISNNGNAPSLTWRGGTPSIYVDEMSTEIDMVSNIPVSDVAYIKVFRPPFTGGFDGANGAIAIYTRKGDDAKNIGKGLSKNKVMGYAPIREFYAPNYDTFNPRNEEADLRTTLYWNPALSIAPKTHRTTVIFYNTDLTKSFRVIIEGMSKEGLLTHMEQIME